jgi:hypothetical protein
VVRDEQHAALGDLLDAVDLDAVVVPVDPDHRRQRRERVFDAEAEGVDAVLVLRPLE